MASFGSSKSGSMDDKKKTRELRDSTSSEPLLTPDDNRSLPDYPQDTHNKDEKSKCKAGGNSVCAAVPPAEAKRDSPETHKKKLAADMAGIMKKSGSVEKFNLREGFYDGTEGSVSRHNLDDTEISRHHRSGEFPHVHTSFSLKKKGHPSKHHVSKHKSKKKEKQVKSTPVDDDIDSFELRGILSAPELHIISETDTDVTDIKLSEPDDAESEMDSVAELLSPIRTRTTTDGGSGLLADLTDRQPAEGTALRDATFYVGSDSNFGGIRESPSGFLQQISTDNADVMPSPSNIEIRSTERPSAVRFQIGSEVFSTSPEKRKSKSKSSKRHHHDRQHLMITPSSAELSRRRYLGSEVKLDERLLRLATDEDEAKGLPDMDLDEIASHRLADPRGLRHRKISRHSAMASVVHIGQQKTKIPHKSKFHDHQPHEMFVELDELHLGDNEEYVWEEKARWIKFEENLEEDTDRWSKPHVASLSFHSLLELRKCLEKGSILLDLDAEDLPGIATSIVDQLVIDDHLGVEEKGAVLKTLLLKHRHVNERTGLRRNLTMPFLEASDGGTPRLSKHRKLSTISSFVNSGSSKSVNSGSSKSLDKKEVTPTTSAKNVNDVTLTVPEVKVTLADSSSHNGSASSTPKAIPKSQSTILKRIPQGAESTTVLIGSVNFLTQPIMAFVRLSEGRYLGNLTEVPLPVRFVFLLMGPKTSSVDYHEIGRSISTLMANTTFHDDAYYATERCDLLDSINEFLDDSIVLPPGEWDKKTLLPIMDMARSKAQAKEALKKKKEHEALHDKEPPVDPLRRTGRLFGGLVNDIKIRYPKYLSDLKDCLNLQCLTTFFFIYFACLAPAITFGGLLREKTCTMIGVSETLIGTSCFGMIFALSSAQPLMIIGVTGPVNVFDAGLVQICDTLDIEYMAMRVWVGLWVTIIAGTLVMFDGSFLVRYFTRFVEEIFASLISLIFIYEALARINKEFHKDYHVSLDVNVSNLENIIVTALEDMNVTQKDIPNVSMFLANVTEAILQPINDWYGYPNTALLSMVLIFGTFLIAIFLKKLRNSKFLGRPIRRAIGDFGVPIAIVVMVLIDFFLIKDTHTEKLDMPSGLSVTNPEQRGWFVNPFGSKKPLPIWAPFMASVLALLVFILIFMETQITSMIVNKKDRKLEKGSGYFFDLLLIGSFSTVSGLLGLPFLCSATVRTVSHVSALSIYSTTHAPGEKPSLLGAHEQRVTGFAVHLMIGLSILLGPLLRRIPVAVLFGVFLYMGVASLSGIQFIDRTKMLFKPVKHHPDVRYVRRVRTLKMHMFTLIQLFGLGILWAIKSTKAALAFPFFLVLLVPVRLFLLRHLFTEIELECLDNEEEAGDDSDEDEPDFYTQVHMPM